MKYTKNIQFTRYPMFNLGYDYYNAETKEEKTKIKNKFRQFLDSLDGWGDVPIEGGYLSPDLRTIIWYGRSPYEFQIGPYSSDGIDITEQRINDFKKENLMPNIKGEHK